jgi:hypothetical protein
MKQIDLSCQLAAPAVAGFFIGAFDNGTDQHHGGDLSGAALWVGIVNVTALAVEYLCTAQIYGLIPELAFKGTRPCPTSFQNASEVASKPNTTEEDADDTERTIAGSCICKLPDGLKEYLDQPLSLGGISLALL